MLLIEDTITKKIHSSSFDWGLGRDLYNIHYCSKVRFLEINTFCLAIFNLKGCITFVKSDKDVYNFTKYFELCSSSYNEKIPSFP